MSEWKQSQSDQCSRWISREFAGLLRGLGKPGAAKGAGGCDFDVLIDQQCEAAIPCAVETDLAL